MTHQPGLLRVAQLSFWFMHADQFCAEALAAPNVELVSVWDNDRARGERKAAEFGVPFEADLDRLLGRPDLDAVSLCAEPFRHPELVEAAAMAGKDMLIEKSMAGNLEGAARIVRAVERHKVRLMPAFSMRFHPVALRVKALVDAGAVGAIGRVRRLHGHFRLSERGGYEFHGIAHEGRWGNPVAERRDSLFYSGSHVALWFQWMFGVPQSVMCMTNTLARALPVEDNSVVLLRYAPAPRPGMEAGFVGVMDCSETLLAQTLVAEIYGTDGVIVQRRGNLPSTRVTGPMPTPLAIFSRARNAWEYPLLPPHFLRHEPDYSCPGVFFRTLLREQPTPMDARDGYDSIALLVAAEQSVRTGHEVAVRPWPRSGGVDGTVA